MAYLFGALICLLASAAPYALLMQLSVGAGRAEFHVSWFVFSLAISAVGLVFCGLGWRRSRIAATLLGLALLGPGALSVVLLREALA